MVSYEKKTMGWGLGKRDKIKHEIGFVLSNDGDANSKEKLGCIPISDIKCGNHALDLLKYGKY